MDVPDGDELALLNRVIRELADDVERAVLQSRRGRARARQMGARQIALQAAVDARAALLAARPSLRLRLRKGLRP